LNIDPLAATAIAGTSFALRLPTKMENGLSWSSPTA
jgi:hypothetical protein